MTVLRARFSSSSPNEFREAFWRAAADDHRTPTSRGGDPYDPDNILVVTPRYHKEVLDPLYHYGGG